MTSELVEIGFLVAYLTGIYSFGTCFLMVFDLQALNSRYRGADLVRNPRDGEKQGPYYLKQFARSSIWLPYFGYSATKAVCGWIRHFPSWWSEPVKTEDDRR